MAHIPSAHMAIQGRTETTSGANPAATTQSHPDARPAIAPPIARPINTQRLVGIHHSARETFRADASTVALAWSISISCVSLRYD